MEENNKEIPNKEVSSEKNTNKNKKIIVATVIIAAIILIVVAVSFCVSNNGLNALINKNIEGYYEIYEINANDTNYSNEEIQSLKKLGLKGSLELKEDKTGILDMFGQRKELTYDNSKMTVNGELIPYKVEGDKIILKQEGEEQIFKKTDKIENTESK